MAASTRETAMSSTEKSRTSVSARYSTPSVRPRSFKGTRRQPRNLPSPEEAPLRARLRLHVATGDRPVAGVELRGQSLTSRDRAPGIRTARQSACGDHLQVLHADGHGCRTHAHEAARDLRRPRQDVRQVATEGRLPRELRELRQACDRRRAPVEQGLMDEGAPHAIGDDEQEQDVARTEGPAVGPAPRVEHAHHIVLRAHGHGDGLLDGKPLDERVVDGRDARGGERPPRREGAPDDAIAGLHHDGVEVVAPEPSRRPRPQVAPLGGEEHHAIGAEQATDPVGREREQLLRLAPGGGDREDLFHAGQRVPARAGGRRHPPRRVLSRVAPSFSLPMAQEIPQRLDGSAEVAEHGVERLEIGIVLERLADHARRRTIIRSVGQRLPTNPAAPTSASGYTGSGPSDPARGDASMGAWRRGHWRSSRRARRRFRPARASRSSPPASG